MIKEILVLVVVPLVMIAIPIVIVLGTAHAKWKELVNPRLKYDNSNDEMSFPNLVMQKTKNII